MSLSDMLPVVLLHCSQQHDMYCSSLSALLLPLLLLLLLLQAKQTSASIDSLHRSAHVLL